MWIFFLVLAVLMIGFYMRCKRPLLSAALGSGSGVLAMLVVGFFTNGLLGFNIFNIMLSTIMGLPGVLTAIVMGKYIL